MRVDFEMLQRLTAKGQHNWWKFLEVLHVKVDVRAVSASFAPKTLTRRKLSISRLSSHSDHLSSSSVLQTNKSGTVGG